MSKQGEKEEIPIALDFSDMTSLAMREFKAYYESERGRRYTREQIRIFLENPKGYERQLREISLHLINSSSHYMRLIFYMSKMLTLDYIVIPNGITVEDMKSTTFAQNYKRVCDYLEVYNIKHELGKVLTIVMSEDIFYGIERRVGDSFMIQRLPSNYCKILGMEDGLFTFSFNMTYFSGDKTKLKNFPSEFSEMYRNFEQTREHWQPVDVDKGVCFKFREDLNYGLPPFTGVFEEVFDLEDLKDMTSAKNKLENFKLLLQKIPFKKEPKSEKDFLIGLDSVKMFHNNIKSVLPEQIGLISSPMEVQDFSFERKNNSDKNSILEKQEEVFNTAGVSSGLFNSGVKSSISLNRAIQVDESMMYIMLRQFERFFNKRISRVSSKKFKFRIWFPDLTVYNRDDMLEKYLKMAQFGFPKSLVACALGLTVNQLTSLSSFENNFLNLHEVLIPLSSSHTQNSDEQARPKKKDSELSDKGLETRDSNANETRAK